MMMMQMSDDLGLHSGRNYTTRQGMSQEHLKQIKFLRFAMCPFSTRMREKNDAVLPGL
jgi:hypothetical protein